MKRCESVWLPRSMNHNWARQRDFVQKAYVWKIGGDATCFVLRCRLERKVNDCAKVQYRDTEKRGTQDREILSFVMKEPGENCNYIDKVHTWLLYTLQIVKMWLLKGGYQGTEKGVVGTWE